MHHLLRGIESFFVAPQFELSVAKDGESELVFGMTLKDIVCEIAGFLEFVVVDQGESLEGKSQGVARFALKGKCRASLSVDIKACVSRGTSFHHPRPSKQDPKVHFLRMFFDRILPFADQFIERQSSFWIGKGEDLFCAKKRRRGRWSRRSRRAQGK